MKKYLVGVLLLLVSLTLVGAEFRYGPNFGIYHGFGFGTQVGTKKIGFEGSVSYTPILFIFYGGSESLDLLSTLDISAGLYSMFGDQDKRFRPGLTVDARFNSFLGFGIGGAFKGIFSTSKMDININVGFKLYFDGQNRVQDEYPSAIDIPYLDTALHFGIGVGLMFGKR